MDTSQIRRLDVEARAKALQPDRIIHSWLKARAYYHPMLFGRGYRMIDGQTWHGKNFPKLNDHGTWNLIPSGTLDHWRIITGV